MKAGLMRHQPPRSRLHPMGRSRDHRLARHDNPAREGDGRERQVPGRPGRREVSQARGAGGGARGAQPVGGRSAPGGSCGHRQNVYKI